VKESVNGHIGTIDESFYSELSENMQNGGELSIQQIYALFPEANKKTISWRVHKHVQQGKLYRTANGYYALEKSDIHNAAGYDKMQNKSKEVYDAVSDYSYEFYFTGLDSLIGETLHLPESYPVLIVIEEAGINEILDVLEERGWIAFTENYMKTKESNILKSKSDIIILRGKDFSLSTMHIAQKEKGFVDLYYAVTRLGYNVSIQELSRIYASMERNRTNGKAKMKESAKDRGISTEINWLMELPKFPEKALEFVKYQTEKTNSAGTAINY